MTPFLEKILIQVGIRAIQQLWRRRCARKARKVQLDMDLLAEMRGSPDPVEEDEEK